MYHDDKIRKSPNLYCHSSGVNVRIQLQNKNQFAEVDFSIHIALGKVSKSPNLPFHTSGRNVPIPEAG